MTQVEEVRLADSRPRRTSVADTADSFKNKIQSGVSKLAPQQARAKAQGKLTEPTDDRPSA